MLQIEELDIETGVTINAQNRGESVHIELWDSDSEKEELEVSELRFGGWIIWNNGESPDTGQISRRGVEIDLPYGEAMKMHDLAVVKTEDSLIVLEQDPYDLE